MESNLITYLSTMVPLRAHELSTSNKHPIDCCDKDYLLEKLTVDAQALVSPSEHKTGYKNALTAVVETLAIMSFVPGGVTWMGMHFKSCYKGCRRHLQVNDRVRSLVTVCMGIYRGFAIQKRGGY